MNFGKQRKQPTALWSQRKVTARMVYSTSMPYQAQKAKQNVFAEWEVLLNMRHPTSQLKRKTNSMRLVCVSDSNADWYMSTGSIWQQETNFLQDHKRSRFSRYRRRSVGRGGGSNLHDSTARLLRQILRKHNSVKWGHFMNCHPGTRAVLCGQISSYMSSLLAGIMQRRESMPQSRLLLVGNKPYAAVMWKSEYSAHVSTS